MIGLILDQLVFYRLVSNINAREDVLDILIQFDPKIIVPYQERVSALKSAPVGS